MSSPVIDLSHTLAAEQFAIFRRAAAVLTSSLELEQALANTISACLPALGDFGFFDVVLDTGVRRTARAHQAPDIEDLLNTTTWAYRQRADLNLCALASGVAVLHSNTDDAWYADVFDNAPRVLEFLSMLSVPVYYGDELIGSLTLFMSTSGRYHDNTHLAFAADLAGLAAPIVVNARLLAKQRQVEADLRYSEERLRVATDAGKIGIWDWDIPSNQVTWSARVYELHGLQQGDFGGRGEDFVARVHTDDRARVWQDIQQAMQDHDIFTAEFRTVWPDGAIHWLSTWARVYRDTNGVAVRMVGSTMDITAQKTTETGLNHRNAQLEQRVVSSLSERDRIWRISQDILAIASLRGYFTAVSPAFGKVLGWDEQEILAIPLMELIHPAQRNEMKGRLDELAQGQPQNRFELQLLHKNGTYRWLSWTFVPEGQLLYGVARDITQLREQREALLSSTEKRLQLALEVGGMGAWEMDMQTGQIIWWPGMDTLHGLAPGSTIQQVEDYLQFIHPDDIDHVQQSFLQTTEGMEYRIVWPDGSVRWIEGRGELFFADNDEPIKMAGICADITRRKLTEHNLRFLATASAELAELVDHEETLRKVAQLAVPSFADWCAVDLLNEQGELKRVAVAHRDPAKVELAHELHNRYPADPASPHGTWNIIRTGQPALISEITEEILDLSGGNAEFLNIIKALGLKSYIGAPLSFRGKTLGVLTFISAESRRVYRAEDVSIAEDIGRRAAIAIENSALYRSLKETDRRKDDFLAMLAHELRNPLAPIKVAADLLNLPLSGEKLKQTSNIIARQVDHMTGLVDDLLDVSRVTQGHVMIERNPVDIAHAVNAAIEQVRPLIEKKCHQLRLAIGPGSLLVEGDEKRLVQVIANLLNNAAKYTPEGGKIELGCDITGDFIELRVSDTGIGMAPDLVASAFDLFIQGKRTTDRSEGGLGLGLALVKSLVELHKGSVQAHSKGPGCGSQFTVRLPQLVARVTTSPQTRSPHQTPTTQSLRILAVDDNIDAAQTLVLFLQMMGHDVNVVYTSHDALNELKHYPYDVLLLDIGLPDMDGNELARRVRTECAHPVPVLIAISGYGQKENRIAARTAGIDHYFVKPVDTTRLLQLLGELKAVNPCVTETIAVE